MKQTLWLPWPPTSNTMFGLKGHHRFVSNKYKAWKDAAGEYMMVQRAITMKGPVSVHITLQAPTKRKWDIDNRLKPCLDILVTHQIIEEDNTEIVKRITGEAGHVDPPGAYIVIEAWT